MKRLIGVFGLLSALLISVNSNAAWHLINGRYVWLSVECGAISKGGGATDTGRLVCTLDDALYTTWCANPDGRITGEGVPSKPMPGIFESSSLDNSEDLGNGKIFTSLELEIAPEYGDTAAIEALLGDGLCEDQNLFFPILAILHKFQSTIQVQQCTSKNVDEDGECVEGDWETKSAKVFTCVVPEEFTSIETYPPPEGTPLDCKEVSE